MTVAELDRWALARSWGTAQIQDMARLLRRYTLVIADRTLCQRWALISDDARRKGRPISTGDAWIAATAMALGVPLVTNNQDDFAGVGGLPLLP